ncbi:MAG: SPOR domain-containing protein [Desulfurivibrionaceae bacterium]|nr:SPOR domain-containing protein [Desulfobulbales bacterium]MDT8334787.1 SPOR domain-containing protein [Desulfurivibrionaceae bacterium]
MAPGKRKSRSKQKGFVVKFELALPGLLGLAVVCFCIFLWMFLLGIWSGQTLFPAGAYRPEKIGKAAPGNRNNIKQKEAAAGEKAVAVPGDRSKRRDLAGTAKKKIVARDKRVKREPEEDPAFFAIQVGAFKDGRLAAKEVEIWKNKGFNSFSRPPTGDDDNFTRVYVGRFDTLDSARDKASAIGREGQVKPFVVLVPDE